jgi:hypothetical protein
MQTKMCQSLHSLRLQAVPFYLTTDNHLCSKQHPLGVKFLAADVPTIRTTGRDDRQQKRFAGLGQYSKGAMSKQIRRKLKRIS